MKDLKELGEFIKECIDQTNEWKLPQGLEKGIEYDDEKNFYRASYRTFCFVLSKIKSIERNSPDDQRTGK